ncbi:MAG: DUF3786 domain-containing protein [Bacillota bacterium]|jgi:hypothetical protein
MADFNLDVTLNKALEEFKKRNPADMEWKTGSTFKDGSFQLEFLGQPVKITHPEGCVRDLNTGGELGLIERILVLHYFLYAGGTPIRNKSISFKELPGGNIYIEPFTNRCIRPLIHLFGNSLSLFQKTAEKLGGTKVKHGDLSYCFYPFPRIPVTLVLWRADEEFPASANIIFDESAADYLHTEDFAFLCGLLAGRLKKLSENIQETAI